MAKGKHAAALFEVIHSGRFPNKPEMRTPKWWFKRKGNGEANDGNGTNGAAESAGATEPSPTSAATTAESVSDPTLGATAQAMLGADPIVAPIVAVPKQADDDGAAERTDSPDTAPSLDVSVDPRHRRITFRVSYSSAIITGFAILVAVALAYAVGRKMARGPTVAVASETTEQLRSRPPHPDVLSVAPLNGAANSPSNGSANNESASPRTNGAATGSPLREPDNGVTSRAPIETHAGANPPLTAAGDQARVVGLNYLVIQSYPDEKSALEARDALLKSGVGCTVEHQKFRGLNPDWYTVVGTQGFAHASGGEYEAYKKRLAELSQEFAQTKRSFKAFALLPYKWDRSN